MIDAKIQNYLISEFQNERLELERRNASPSDFLSCKCAEFYQTIKRFLRLVHLQYGSRATRTILSNSRKNLHLFPVAATASAGSFAAPGQRILIDVTDTLCFGPTTGIQRVVRQLAKTAMENGTGISVFIQNERLFSYLRHPSIADEIEITEGDKFVMADLSWNDISRYQAVMERISRKGGANILVLHDIIPLMYPALYPLSFYPHTVPNHANWFDKIVVNADAVVADTKSVAEDFLAYVAANKKVLNSNLRLGWNHLGADFVIGTDETLSEPISAICSNMTPFFLSVGTFEPRKGLSIALDAMDRLWNRGIDVRYVIAGRVGYCVRALERRILSHVEFGRRLFWLNHASDADLCALYKHARALIFASVTEGFGLPLVEAAHFGLPAIVSDIPVFREIGGDAVTYFDVADSESLATRIHEALASPKTANVMPFSTWQEATEKLLRMIREDAYQFGPVGKRPLIAAG